MKSFEYHVGGQPVRVIVEGVPAPQGRTQPQKAAWFARHADRCRRGLVLAPRGHADMNAVLLTEPSSAEAHAGLVFLDASGYPRFALPAIVAAATAAVEHNLVSAGTAEGRALVFDTPAGVVSALVSPPAAPPGSVLVRGVPAFVYAAGLPVTLPSRTIPVDIAFAGEFLALVDGEAAGVPLDVEHVPELRRLARAICTALSRTTTVAHPLDPTIDGVAGVVFSGPARDPEVHLRTVLVTAAGAVDWSPGASATAAVMAVLDAIGLVAEAPSFTHEGLSGAQVTGRLVSRGLVDQHPSLVVEVAARAWPTGEQAWILDHDDPFHQGLTAAPADR
jgi:trans-L-3-hydroxyproline dehydratase